MASLFGEVRSDFYVIGELQSKRIITSEKMKDWRLYIFKIAAKGCTLEIEVSQDEHSLGIIKSPYQITGAVTVEQGRTKLIADVVKLLGGKTA